jgi:hypothetical protein
MNPRWLVDLGKLAFVIVILLLLYKAARGQDFPNCTEFGFQISGACCCTNNCCSEADEGEFRHIGGDIYQSTVTGQTLKRTGWSPDGRFVKCACDLVGGQWTKHPKANVRCVFPPLPSS